MINSSDEIYDLNKKYEANNFNGLYNGITNLRIIYGNLPILLSAPHSVKHFRNNQLKRSDGLTGGIVEYLAKYNNTFGITRISNLLDDPNYYNSGISLRYKENCIKLIDKYNINCLLDIHGCKDSHPFDIDIGTSNYNEELDIIYRYLSNLGKVEVNKLFKASHKENVTRYVQNQSGIPCFQIELSSNVRFNKTNELVNEFNNIIEEMKVKKLIRK